MEKKILVLLLLRCGWEKRRAQEKSILKKDVAEKYKSENCRLKNTLLIHLQT